MPVASDQGVTRAPAGVQGGRAQALHARIGVRLAQLGGVAALLGGCSGGATLASINPVDWWHGLEGGPIAQTRPPPPNADAPYPNLGSVPAKPPPPDKAAQARVAGALVADRANAVYDASIAPIPTPPPTVRPPRPDSGAPDQANASLAAATAPPAPRPEPPPAAGPVARKAPVAPVAAADLPAPAAAPPAGIDMPAIPDAPPPATPPAPPPPAPIAGAPVAIPFPPGSAVLPAAGLAPIKQLALLRGPGVIAVTGFGDAASTDPSAQSAALPLALDRARAVAAGLLADGVPATSIRIGAEPQGSGAAASVIR